MSDVQIADHITNSQDAPTTPTKSKNEAAVPPAPKKKRRKIQPTAPSPTAPIANKTEPTLWMIKAFVEEQKKQLEDMRGSVYITGMYEGLVLVNLKDLFLHFMHSHHNLFYFVDHDYRPFIVKGPVTENEYEKTKALQSIGMTLPTRFLRFYVPFDLPTKRYTTYLLQPLYGSDLFEIQNSDRPLRGKELRDVICLLLKKLATLHHRGYFHGDVSPENFVYSRCLLDAKQIPGGPIHLIDFPMAGLISKHREFGPYGKTNYTEPFLKNCLEFQHKPPDWYRPEYPDIFAVGIVIWTMVFNSLPVLIELAKQGTKNYILNCGLPPLSDGLLDLLESLIDTSKEKSVQSSLDKFEESFL